MGAFDWVSYREWSRLDSVESCGTVGEEEEGSQAGSTGGSLLSPKHMSGGVASSKNDTRMGKVDGTSAHNAQIQTLIPTLMIKCSGEEGRK